ncbi:MAG: DUF4375 domain-containing protein [Pyrinomonadaceae bacterium]
MTEKDIQPGDLYWQAIEPIWDRISIYDGPTPFLKQIQCVQPYLRNLFAAHWCQSEVYKGGLHQFFWNSTGVLAPEAVEGFLALGLTDCAVILQEAMAVFGPTYSRERSERTEGLSLLLNEDTEEEVLFKALDVRFFAAIGLGCDRFCQAADAYTRSAAR